MMIPAEDEDVIAQSPKPDGRLPRGFSLHDPVEQVIFTPHEELDRVNLAPGLLSFEHTTDAIAYPPNATTGCALPNSPDSLRFFPRHDKFSGHKISKDDRVLENHSEPALRKAK